MSRHRLSVWTILAVMVLTTLPASSQVAALRVVSAGPTGELTVLADADDVRIVFSEPMVAVGTVPSGTVPSWVHITPAAPGSFYWSGTKTLMFAPDTEAALPYATRFTVRVDGNATSVDGRAIGTPYEFTFTTPTVRLLGVSWRRTGNRFDDPAHLVLRFNQRVRPEDVLAHVRVRLEPHPWPAPVLSGTAREYLRRADRAGLDRFDEKIAAVRRVTSSGEPVPVRLATTWDLNRFPATPEQVVLETATAPPTDGWLQIDTDNTLPSPAGQMTHAAQAETVRLEPTLFVTGMSCVTGCNPGSFNGLQSTRPFRLGDIRSALTITDVTDPANERAIAPVRDLEDDVATQVIGNVPVEQTGFDAQPPSRRRRLALKPDIVAADGQVLGYPWTDVVETVHAQPAMSLSSGVWESRLGAELPVSSVNATSRIAWVGAVTPATIVERLRAIEPVYPTIQSAIPPLPGPAETRPLAIAPDTWGSHPLDLRRLLSPAATGIVAATVQMSDLLPGAFPIPQGGNRPQGALVQITNLGISVKDSRQSTLVFVTALDTGQPVAGASVAVVDMRNTTRWSGVTGADGVAIAPVLPLRKPDNPSALAFIVTARNGDDVAFIGSNWSGDTSPWSWSLNYGVQPFGEIAGSAFTDRGTYRETEDVRIKAILREYTAAGPREWPAGTAFNVRVEDARGREIDRRTIRTGRWSSADWTWRVPADAALGSYNVSISKAGVVAPPNGDVASVSASFLVAAYRTPDFRVDTTLSAEPLVLGSTLRGTIDAKYLFGGALADRPVRWWVHRQFGTTVPGAIRERFRADRYDVGYEVRDDDPDRQNAQPQDRHETLRADGRLDVSWPTVADDDIGATFTLEGDVEDVAGQHISNRAFLAVHPASLYVVVSKPASFVDTRTGFAPRIVAVDLAGRSVPDVAVTLALFREEWVRVPPRSRNTRGSYSPYGDWERRETPAGDWTLRTAAAEASLPIPVQDGGSYILRATARDAQGRRTRTDMRFYATGGGASSWRANGRRFDLTPERHTVAPGEMARLLIQSPWAQATALMTVEREGIRRHRVFTIHSTQDVVDVPVNAGDAPNVYVSVLLVKGRTSTSLDEAGDDTGRPDYRMGYTQLTIDDATKRLRVDVSADKKEYRPRDAAKVSLTVRDSGGKPAVGEVTLWAVDYGVLSLTGYAAPDLVSAIYSPRMLGVMTEDSRSRLIDRGMLRSGGIIGGVIGGIPGGLIQTSMATVSVSADSINFKSHDALNPMTFLPAVGADATPAVRTDFRTLAFWLGSATTDATGRLTTTVTLPDSLTTYRILAVAAGASRFGVGDHEIRVSKPLSLLPEFPRFLNAGDRASFSAVVSNSGKEPGSATVAVQSLDPAALEFGTVATRTIRVAAGASVAVSFDAVARAGGRARVRMTATLGTESDAFEMPLAINTPLRQETTAAYGETIGRAVERLTLPPGIARTTGGLSVELSSTALVGLTESARYLTEYPYECAEQRASRALALLLASDLGSTFRLPGLTPAQYRAEATRTLRALTGDQCGSGGFSMWPEACGSESAYLTAYVLHVMKVAEGLRVPIDRDATDRALDYLEGQLQEPAPLGPWQPVWGASQAFAVKVLAESGRPPAADVTRLVNAADRLPIFALSYLADALAAMRDRGPRYQEIVRRLTNALRTQADRAHVEEIDEAALSWLWTTNTRATAVVLDGFSRRGDAAPFVSPLVRWLVASRSDGRWSTTHENATALEALVSYYRAVEPQAPEMTATVTVGSAAVGSAKFSGRSTASQQVQVSMADLLKNVTGTNPTLTVARTGTGRLYYTARVRSVAPEPPTPVDRGIQVERRYEHYVPKGKGPVATSFAAGDLIRVVVTLGLRGEGRYLALTDPLPAGFEPIEDWFLTTASDLAQEAVRVNDPSDWLSVWRRGTFDHVEKHDDRVVGFATRLGPGRHEFSYLVRATTAGTFGAAGARVEAMYAPELTGRSAAATVIIK